MSKGVAGSLRWIAALMLPVFLVLTATRLLVGDWFPRFEYAKPDFPPDRYGWTQSQRLDLALPSIHFLNSPLPAEQAVSILAAQRQPGTNSALFTPNELGHMTDVKRVVDAAWRTETIAGLLLFASLALLLARRRTRQGAYVAMFVGGILTVVLLFALALFVVTGFDTFFVLFHEVFFPQGNWTFDYSDSLIRLFPEKLWFDAGFMISGSTLIAGLIVGAVGRLLLRRGQPAGAQAASATRPSEAAGR